MEQPSITDTSNPSTKKKGFNIYDSYKKAIKKITSSASSSTSAVNIEESLSVMVMEYLSEPVMDNPEDRRFMDPFEYWRNNKERYSMLAVMAKKYLLAPPSSVPSESLFSDTGIIIDSSRRRCLLAEKLVMLTFIKET